MLTFLLGHTMTWPWWVLLIAYTILVLVGLTEAWVSFYQEARLKKHAETCAEAIIATIKQTNTNTNTNTSDELTD